MYFMMIKKRISCYFLDLNCCDICSFSMFVYDISLYINSGSFKWKNTGSIRSAT